jgi:hypothetical protein
MGADMKKILLMVMCTLALLMLSGCSIGPDTNSLLPQSPSKYARLWCYNLPQSEYVRTGASRSISWKSSNVSLDWSSGILEYNNYSYANGKKLEKNGITYFLTENAAAWDGTDADHNWVSGTYCFRQLFYEKDGFAYQLSASAIQKSISLKAASLEKALALAVNPDMVITGFKKTTEMWFTAFKNGNLSVSITICPPPFDQQEYDLYAKECTLMNETDGSEYYTSRLKVRTEADPLFSGVYVKTDIGTISIRGGTPYGDRNSVPAESLDFIGIELARAVAAAIRND